MKREARVGPCQRAAVGWTAAFCFLVMFSNAALGIAVDPTANLGGAAPDGGAGTGLRGQFFDSGGDLNSIRTLLNASTAPNRVWNVSVVDYPNGGNHNIVADTVGLRSYLGVDRPTLTPGFNIQNIDNSRFAMRGFIEITAAMDLVPGGVINTNLRLDSDDDGNIVINGGLDASGITGAVGLNLARNVTHAVEFPSAGFYQFDVIYQESTGNTGVTLSAQLAGINGGALAVAPMSLFAPNLSQTPAPAALGVNVPVAPLGANIVAGLPGLAGQFFDSGGSVATIRTLLNTNTVPDRTWVMTSPDYPQGGGNNAGSDASGLVALLGTDAPSLSGPDIANIDNSRFAIRGFVLIDTAMDMDLVAPGVQIMMRLNADDDANIVIGGGLDADGTTPGGSGLNLARNTDHFLTFVGPGFYQFDILWQESGGNTGIFLEGQLANVNNGFQGLLPSSMFFRTVNVIPEPATALMGIVGMGALAIRRRRTA